MVIGAQTTLAMRKQQLFDPMMYAVICRGRLSPEKTNDTNPRPQHEQDEAIEEFIDPYPTKTKKKNSQTEAKNPGRS